MSEECVKSLTRSTRTVMPEFSLRDRYAHVHKAGEKGWRTTKEKYGRIPKTENREKAWRVWWETQGKHKPNAILQARAINKPKKSSELAEFLGMMIGDGGMSKYQITITLHRTLDAQYGRFVVNTIQNLFRVTPHIRHVPQDSVMHITVSRKNLVEYLNSIGLPIGDKIRNKIDIPAWILKNRAYKKAVVRGLMDTDGCVVIHRYRTKGKSYVYKKLMFSNKSEQLLNTFMNILQSMRIKARWSKNSIWIDGQGEVEKYIKTIGFHNPKHLKRYLW